MNAQPRAARSFWRQHGRGIVAHAGVPVTFGGRETWGILRTADEEATDELGTDVTVRQTTLTVWSGDLEPAGALAGVDIESTLTAGGERYVVRNVSVTGGGGRVLLLLAEE